MIRIGVVNPLTPIAESLRSQQPVGSSVEEYGVMRKLLGP